MENKYEAIILREEGFFVVVGFIESEQPDCVRVEKILLNSIKISFERKRKEQNFFWSIFYYSIKSASFLLNFLSVLFTLFFIYFLFYFLIYFLLYFLIYFLLYFKICFAPFFKQFFTSFFNNFFT